MTALVPKRPLPAKRQRLRDLAFAGIRSPKTVALYEGDWKRFLAWADLGEMGGLFKLPKEDAALLVDEYLQHLEAEGRKPATRARAKQAICSITDKLYVAGVVPWTLRGLALIRDPQVSPYSDLERVTHADWLALLHAAQGDGTTRGVRDVAILLLLHDSALRSREVATLRLRDYVREKARVRVWQKGRDVANRVDVALTPRTRAALDAWCAVRSPCETLFHAVGVRRRESLSFDPERVAHVVRFWCRRAGLEPVGPHQLRHAAITRLAQRGADLKDIQRFARHADVNTTVRYIHAGGAGIQRCHDILESDDE